MILVHILLSLDLAFFPDPDLGDQKFRILKTDLDYILYNSVFISL